VGVLEKKKICHSHRDPNPIPSIQSVAYPGMFFGERGSTNSVDDRENGDLGAVTS
jgi:hypothetical protein